MEKERIWVLGAPDPEMKQIETLLRYVGERIAYAAVDGRDGQPVRVLPREAYSPTLVLHENGCAETWLPDTGGTVVILVECDYDGNSDRIRVPRERVLRIDHHRPGDPGYGRAPSEFLPASSLGQVIYELARLDASEGARVEWQRFGDGSDTAWRVEVYDPKAEVSQYTYWVAYGDRGTRAIDASGQRERDYALALTAAADHCLAAAYAGKCPGVDPAALDEHRTKLRAEHLR